MTPFEKSAIISYWRMGVRTLAIAVLMNVSELDVLTVIEVYLIKNKDRD